MSYNKAMLAQLNKKIVLEMIRTQGPINKAEIARKAELSIPTVMKITEEFERENLVKTIGKGESTGGKRPDLLEFVSNAYYITGIDIGRHYVKIVIIDMAAVIMSKECFPTTEEDIKQPKQFLEKIAERVEALIIKSGISKGRFMGIGIGMPGILDYARGDVIFSPDFNWVNVPLMEIFRNQLPFYKIFLENANRALALGEYIYGAAKNADYILCINLGYGIGAAIIESGQLLYGKSGTCGEFGHMIMEPDGPLCDCGNQGCLEALASGNAIAKRMEREIMEGKQTLVSRAAVKQGKIEAEMVFEAARAGDILSRKIIDEAMEYVGIAIASSINLLDPDMIILAGGLTKSKDLFLDQLQRTVEKYKMKYSGKNVSIRTGTLGEYATAIGAAAMLIRLFIENGGEL